MEFYPTFNFRNRFKSDVVNWHRHFNFGFDLIRCLEPKSVVELGVHKGIIFLFFESITTFRFAATVLIHGREISIQVIMKRRFTKKLKDLSELMQIFLSCQGSFRVRY